MHDNYIYGLDAKGILPTLISPTEVIDGGDSKRQLCGPMPQKHYVSSSEQPLLSWTFCEGMERTVLCRGLLLPMKATMLSYKKRAGPFLPKN